MIEIRNKLTKVSTVIEDNATVPEGWTDKVPKWVEFEMWDDVISDWIIDTAAKSNAAITVQIADIDAQLNTLDLKSIRSRGEILDGEDTDGKAAEQLAKYKAEIAALRKQRKTLTDSIKSV